MTLYMYNRCTVKPLNKGHIGGQYKFTCFVPCREVVLFSEVQILLLLYIGKQNFRVPRTVHLRGSTIGCFTVHVYIQYYAKQQELVL